MKKATTKRAETNGLRAEYDFTGGMRGKHFRAMQAGYTITIHQADGSTVVKEVKPRQGAVILEPDVQSYFPDSDSVNTTLRSLINLLPAKRKANPRKARSLSTQRRMASGGRGNRAR